MPHRRHDDRPLPKTALAEKDVLVGFLDYLSMCVVGKIQGVPERTAADKLERQVSGYQRLAGRRELLQEMDPHAGRFLGVVFEAVEPVGFVEPTWYTAPAANVTRSPPEARRTTLCPGCGRRCDRTETGQSE